MSDPHRPDDPAPEAEPWRLGWRESTLLAVMVIVGVWLMTLLAAPGR